MKPVQVARVYIVSPIYTGYFEALCVEDQKHNLLHNAKNSIRIGPTDGPGPKESHSDESWKNLGHSIIPQQLGSVMKRPTGKKSH